MQKSRNSPPLPPPSSSYSLTAATDFGFGQKASPFPSVPRQLAEEWRESEEMAKGQTVSQNEKWWDH